MCAKEERKEAANTVAIRRAPLWLQARHPTAELRTMHALMYSAGIRTQSSPQPWISRVRGVGSNSWLARNRSTMKTRGSPRLQPVDKRTMGDLTLGYVFEEGMKKGEVQRRMAAARG